MGGRQKRVLERRSGRCTEWKVHVVEGARCVMTSQAAKVGAEYSTHWPKKTKSICSFQDHINGAQMDENEIQLRSEETKLTLHSQAWVGFGEILEGLRRRKVRCRMEGES